MTLPKNFFWKENKKTHCVVRTVGFSSVGIPGFEPGTPCSQKGEYFLLYFVISLFFSIFVNYLQNTNLRFFGFI
jgi:hypothetical protein